MFQLSEKSLEKLNQCHPDLVRLFMEIAKYYPLSIIEGHRGQAEQNEAFRTGKSKLKFPESKHNKVPSLAVDAVPMPINWNNKEEFYHFAGFVLATAINLGIKIRWGGDWDVDLDLRDQTFFDLPHFELVD